MKRVLYDTNVILDVLLKREPHFTASAQALNMVGEGKVEGYLSAHAVTTLAYLLQRQLSKTQSRLVLNDLLSHLRVAPVTEAAIRQALQSPFADFEDAVCHAVAREVSATAIITRNLEDFRHSTIPVIQPSLFQP